MWKDFINSFVTESRAHKRDASVWETQVRECVMFVLSRTSAVEATRPHHTKSCSWAASNSSGLVWRAQRRAADSRAWATEHSFWLAGKMQLLPHRCRIHIVMCICILSCAYIYIHIVMCIHVYIHSAPVVLLYVCMYICIVRCCYVCICWYVCTYIYSTPAARFWYACKTQSLFCRGHI